MKKYLFPILSHVLCALIAVVVTLIVVYTSMTNNQGKLMELQNVLNQKYIGQIDWDSLEEAAAQAIIDALDDRWSYYMTAEEYLDHKDQANNAFVGIGVTVVLRADGQGLDVTKVTPGGPAAAAGMLQGDILVAVDGESVIGMSADLVRDKIRGEAGTKTVLTFLRNGTSYDTTVTRAYVQVPVAADRMLEDNIGLITIENFDSRCADETIAAIQSLQEQGAEKLIFDVRYNPGGFKSELVKLLDHLLPKGVIFRSEYYDGTVSTSNSDANCVDMPIAVLINGSTYSAAEYFAAALWEYEAAVLVGEQTVGKGYFQNVIELKDGSAVSISIGKYYTPIQKISLEDVGLIPDVIVEIKNSEIAQGIYYGTLDPMEDPQVLAAIAVLQGQ